MPDINLLEVDRGSVVAPAGCGKTQLIVSALTRHTDPKPVLILTHTNAGVAALRARLLALGVPQTSYRLATIDGWSMRLTNLFPQRSGYSAGPNVSKPDYPLIRKASMRLLKSGDIADILSANYGRLLVDEYQDCSIEQHAIVYHAARSMPTCVLGDPMQAIFGFKGNTLVDWDKYVATHFPLVGSLNIPWRWVNSGTEELGKWLLEAREILHGGGRLDLTMAPPSVRVTTLLGDAKDYERLVQAAQCKHKNSGETTLVIGDSRSAQSRHKIAKSVPGIVTIEPVDLGDVTKFASSLDLAADTLVSETLNFAESVITNVGANSVLERCRSIACGAAKKPPNEIEAAALALSADPSLPAVAELLAACSAEVGNRTFRPGVLRAALKAISMCGTNQGLSFADAAVRVREENRAVGRQLPRNAIGSTLLLKGLEADHVVVLNASDLDARNLYVAMTRGAKTVTLCSRSGVLAPSQ